MGGSEGFTEGHMVGERASLASFGSGNTTDSAHTADYRDSNRNTVSKKKIEISHSTVNRHLVYQNSSKHENLSIDTSSQCV